MIGSEMTLIKEHGIDMDHVHCKKCFGTSFDIFVDRTEVQATCLGCKYNFTVFAE